ncbi:MAG TPA: hypothetical protein VGK73_36185 [Polyangiaceae bacterium]
MRKGRAARRALAWLGAASALSCNAVLGISETSYRGEDGPGGKGGDAAGGTGATGGSGAAPIACTTHAECLEATGEFDPSACVGGQCVRLLTPECPLALPQTDRGWLENLRRSEPDPVIFGVFTSVPPELFGIESKNYDLVLTEVTREVGGIPAAGGKRRPVLAVVCRNLYDEPEGFDRAIDHLIDELEVPGVLAALESGDLEYAFRRKGSENHVFFMSAFEADRSLVELRENGLVWHMLPGGEQVAPTYGPLFDRTVAHLRESGRIAAGDPVRVGLVTTHDVRVMSSLSGALLDGILKINGLPARENPPETFREVSIPSSVLANEVPDYTEQIQLLRALSPHIILGIATDEFLTTILPALETGTRDFEPFYLLSPWHIQTDLIRPPLVQFPELYTRIAGVNFAAALDQTVYDDYQARFDAAFPAFAGTRGYENFYDAGYYLIYAAAAAGTVVPLLGSDLANGMQRLLSGRLAFDVGPDDLRPAFVELETPGSSIVLNGAMGPPNFDPQTGAREEPGTVWCVDESQTLHTDVLRLVDGTLEGTFPCFEFGEP